MLRKHLTYANVISTLALVIALGMGSTYAAGQLGQKSIGAKQLRPGAVTADKLRKNAVTAPKIKALAVKKGKIGFAAVTAAKIATNAVTGAKLPAGVVTGEKIAADTITGEQVDESSLGRVPNAASASFATSAGSANPEAFARVNEEGTTFPDSSKGIDTADVKRGKEAGIYCVSVPAFTPRGAQVTPEFTANAQVSAFVKFGGTPSCPYPQVEVQTFTGGTRQEEPFYIMLYR